MLIKRVLWCLKKYADAETVISELDVGPIFLTQPNPTHNW